MYQWTNGDSYTGDWRDGVPQVKVIVALLKVKNIVAGSWRIYLWWRKGRREEKEVEQASERVTVEKGVKRGREVGGDGKMRSLRGAKRR